MIRIDASSGAVISHTPAPRKRTFEDLETAARAMREQDDETPQWEFCEGFMAALVCTRRAIAPTEYWPVLFNDFVPTK